MFDVTVNTNKTIEEAITALEFSLQNHKFGVLWKLDLQGTLQKKGMEYDHPYYILEVCNPSLAKQVLDKNQMGGYLLPCKVVVYQDEQQQTKIGFPRPSALIGMVEDDRLATIAGEVEQALTAAINEAK